MKKCDVIRLCCLRFDVAKIVHGQSEMAKVNALFPNTMRKLEVSLVLLSEPSKQATQCIQAITNLLPSIRNFRSHTLITYNCNGACGNFKMTCLESDAFWQY